MQRSGGGETSARGAAWAASPLALWLPVPLLLLAVLGLSALDLRASRELPLLFAALNLLFAGLGSALIAALAARSFLARGAPELLLLGSGTLVLGGSFAAISLAVQGGPSATSAVHNLGVLLAALLQAAGAARSLRPGRVLGRRRAWLALGYLGGAAAVLLLVALALSGALPPFFEPGRGGTPVRQAALLAAVALLAAAARLWRASRETAQAFREPFAAGLALLAVGLLGLLLQPAQATAVGWLGRATQYLGFAWMFRAALAASRHAGSWGLSLREVLARTQARLAEVEERESLLAAVIEGTSDGYVFMDVEAGRVIRSPQLFAMAEVTPDEAPATIEGWTGRIHPEDAPRVHAAMAELLAGGRERIDEEYRLRTSTGAWKWLRSRSKVVRRGPDGKPLRIAGMVSDVDAQRRARERELHEARLRSLSHGINEIEVVSRPDGSVVEVNDRAVEAYGYSREELLRLNVRDMRPSGTEAATAERLRRVAESGSARYESEHRRRDGTLFPVELSIRAVAIGGETFLLGLIRDLTGVRAAAAEQQRLVAELRQALQRVRTLTGLLPLCMHCHKIRDDQGHWAQLEEYITEHSQASFSHGLCPDCFERHYPRGS